LGKQPCPSPISEAGSQRSTWNPCGRANARPRAAGHTSSARIAESAARHRLGSGGAAFVVVMEAADVRERDVAAAAAGLRTGGWPTALLMAPARRHDFDDVETATTPHLPSLHRRPATLLIGQ